jgi:hypothetical protein
MSREDRMIKAVLAGMAAISTVSGAALAQTYIPMSPPPAAFAPPSVIAPRTPTTTTTAASSPDADHRGVTIHKVVDRKSNAGSGKEPLADAP